MPNENSYDHSDAVEQKDISQSKQLIAGLASVALKDRGHVL
jgi:hypothetical protein